MLIPSIDLMGGKIVQLIQGRKKALEFDDFDQWAERFSHYPLVQLIDLDAAMGHGSNRKLVGEFCGKLTCQVGGGIRSVADAQAAIDCGANRVILGSSLIQLATANGAGELCQEQIDVDFAEALSEQTGANRLTFAIDSHGGQVAIHGWKTITKIKPASMMKSLEPFCSAFLYTHIDSEGLMKGIPMDVINGLRRGTSRRLIAAGGISTRLEIDELERLGIDAVVGMAVYSGLLPV